MATKTRNYQKGKIYSIRSFQTDKVYYGSTTQSLSKRLSTHKAHYKIYLNGKHNYITSYEIIKYDDNYIELVELFPCTSRSELDQREGQIIRANGDAINKNIAGKGVNVMVERVAHINHEPATKKQINNAKYYKNNVLYIMAKHDCVCGGKYSSNHKLKHQRTNKHVNFISLSN